MSGILSKAFKGAKFAASATIGIPCAVAATAFVGSAYLVSEATNIVEAKVFHPYGFKLVHKNPFFEGVSNSLYKTLQSIWKDYGAYSHISFANWALQKRKRHFDFSENSEAEFENNFSTAENLGSESTTEKASKINPHPKIIEKENKEKVVFFEENKETEQPQTSVTNFNCSQPLVKEKEKTKQQMPF